MSRPLCRGRVTMPILPLVVALALVTAVTHLRHPAPLNGATVALIVFTIAAVVAADRKALT